MPRVPPRSVAAFALCALTLSVAAPAGAVVPLPAEPAGAASRVVPLPVPDVQVTVQPETAIEPVERLAQRVQRTAATLGSRSAPASATASSGSAEAQQAQSSVAAPPEQSSAGDSPSKQPSSRGRSKPSRPEGSDPLSEDDSRGQTPSATEPAATEPAAPSGRPAASESRRPGTAPPSDPPSSSPTVVERIVGVVPLPVQIALGVLVALLLAALAGTWRTRRRLGLAERQAATDVLTGLPNRRHADEVIERLLAAARRHERQLAVVLFDLDHFKAINDNFGHGVGDDALRCVADTTRGMLRGSDHVARFGGEEFVLLLPETSAADAATVADKLRLRIAELDVDGLEGGMTASFGVAVYPDHGAGAAELIALADAALYQAKEAGRDRVTTAAESLLAVAA